MGKLSESGTRNRLVTPVWGGSLLVHLRFCIENIMTVADTRRFVASRGARRSGIAAPLWHIWLPAAPLRQLASSYEHACKWPSRVPCCISCMHGESRIEYSMSHIFHDFSVRGSTRIHRTPVLFTGTGSAEFTGSRVDITRLHHSMTQLYGYSRIIYTVRARTGKHRITMKNPY
jgi:hypothetical protein